MQWIDYKELRKNVPIIRVMSDYEVALRGSGDQRKGRCPFNACRDNDGLSFSINVAKGLWKCWRCGLRGHVIDFVARMENLNPADTQEFRRAAQIVAERYGAGPDRPANQKQSERSQRPAPRRHEQGGRRYVNQPLDFELKDLDPRHPAIEAIGLKLKTVEHFGLGFCSRRGMLEGRIAIPLHDAEGQLVGYCGRLANESKATSDAPLYLFPEQERVRRRDNAVMVFDQSKLVYNAHRVKAPVANLIVADDVSDVWHLHDAGVMHAVAIFPPLSSDQQKVIERMLLPNGTAWFLTSGKDPVDMFAGGAATWIGRWLYTVSRGSIRSQARKAR